ncbi:chromosome partitioning protein ParB [Halobacillus halophilus]|uniref:Stage 0 sporulation protein J n=1 Tax=Halobacillus halophilus (strain ATCC 35676 / DSM 2266 / JCM 20832 / KCTC 3685 / LMG 17431 / NBRC 102448 / NCIMB 2269) TaxID=866895 RepID=I0JTL4_HALH3|nr:ParB/RepB/Spo0J family partition protein [Halobacillus halophilus]ASF41395.1 chromosome partitioning protein ParB [Halobacillus halophilus]CCG47487.1 stage 0 sporulation protein J [Halobacillus halophilus DSM 2266]
MAKGSGKETQAVSQEMERKEEEQIQEIPVHECRPNPYQPRKHFTDEAIQELKESIEEHGILQPLIVRKSIKGFEIVVGERRFRAAKRANLETVPALVRVLTDEQMMELALLENLQREDLTPIEEAKAYQNLMNELSLTQELLSKRLGKSRSHIANLVRLLSLPVEVTRKINDGTLSMGHGRALLGLKNREQVIALASRIEKEALNVRQAERLIFENNKKDRTEKKKPSAKDIFIRDREESLRERLGTEVTIHKGKQKGRIEIEFMDEEDLERILQWFDKDS